MYEKENLLRGKVVAKFGSIAEFAKFCGFSYAKAYRLIVGAQSRSDDDIRTVVLALGLNDAEEIVSLFSLR